MKNVFGGAIWTDHALIRMAERKIPKEFAIATISSPEETTPSEKGGVRMRKVFGAYTVTLVAKRNERSEWVVVSIWMDPPMAGTKDVRKKRRYQEYRKGGIGKKIWLTILKQLGL